MLFSLDCSDVLARCGEEDVHVCFLLVVVFNVLHHSLHFLVVLTSIFIRVVTPHQHVQVFLSVLIRHLLDIVNETDGLVWSIVVYSTLLCVECVDVWTSLWVLVRIHLRRVARLLFEHTSQDREIISRIFLLSSQDKVMSLYLWVLDILLHMLIGLGKELGLVSKLRENSSC